MDSKYYIGAAIDAADVNEFMSWVDEIDDDCPIEECAAHYTGDDNIHDSGHYALHYIDYKIGHFSFHQSGDDATVDGTDNTGHDNNDHLEYYGGDETGYDTTEYISYKNGDNGTVIT